MMRQHYFVYSNATQTDETSQLFSSEGGRLS